MSNLTSLIDQIQKLEQIFDELHEDCAEAFGDNSEMANLALKGSCRSFAILCDFMAMQGNVKDD